MEEPFTQGLFAGFWLLETIQSSWTTSGEFFITLISSLTYPEPYSSFDENDSMT